MMKSIFRQATIINEGQSFVSDLLVSNHRIEKIAPNISLGGSIRYEEINAEGFMLIPGMIDDQVHFREPGLTHKGTIETESKAAVAGGITSFMEMPNTIPNVLNLQLLEEKYQLAQENSWANFSFFMGISKNNLEDALRIDNELVCGITDDGLYFNDDEGILANHPYFLEKLFDRSNSLIALHSEDDAIIDQNLLEFKETYGRQIPCEFHSKIRTSEACLLATKRVLDLAKKANNRLHFFHISTYDEAKLFAEFQGDLKNKRITSEACIHHLFFNESHYQTLGNKIKWNPSVKTVADNIGLIHALNNDVIDIIATDHAPHSWDEKNGDYFSAKSGGPLVQHALLVLLELFKQGKISLEKMVEKTSHHVAEIYRIPDRGYIREGYYADLVLIDLHSATEVTKESLLYKCGWSPFENAKFSCSINRTYVNGSLVYDKTSQSNFTPGFRLKFEKIR
jgi:dihydroorotase